MNFLQPYMPVVTLIGELTILAVLSILILGFVLLILTVL